MARGSVAFGWSRTDLAFADRGDASFEKLALTYGTDFRLGGTFTLNATAGAVLDGTLHFDDEDPRDLGVGWLGALGLSWRVLDEGDKAPFIVLSLTLAGMGTTARGPGRERASYYGVDTRFGVILGKTFGDVVSPYAAVRVFGGPVILDEIDDDAVIGTDKFHVQPAIGVVFLLPAGIDVFADVAPFLEKSVLGGVGLSF